MRVIVPYTDLRKETKKALKQTGYKFETVFVGNSDSDYFDLLSDLWRKGETFAIVEHDIVVHPTALAELEQCSSDWCAFPSYYFNSTHVGLGCVKFGSTLIKAHPYAMDQVGTISDNRHEVKHWCRLDAWLQQRVLPATKRHVHSNVVGHVRSGSYIKPSHGCC